MGQLERIQNKVLLEGQEQVNCGRMLDVKPK